MVRAWGWVWAVAALLAAAGCTAPILLEPAGAPDAVRVPAAAEQHVVAEGETLFTIAMRLGVDVTELAELNNLRGEPAVGQLLALPPRGGTATAVALAPAILAQATISPVEIITEVAALLPTATPQTPVPAEADEVAAGAEQTGETAAAAGIAAGPPSLLNSQVDGDLDAFYSLAYPADRFVLRYAPGSRAAQDPAHVASLVQRALDHHEQTLGIHLNGGFTAYAAGTLFAPPDQPLRGYSFSKDRYFVFLHDGSGSAADQAYLAAHELMHLMGWNIWGRPSSFLVSEGIAVHAGMQSIADSAQMPIDDFCLAFARAGRLPWISDDTLPYRGHNRNLDNYYAAGCFVSWLIDRYGVEPFGRVYPTSDYPAVYGRSLQELDAEWHAEVLAQRRPLSFAEADLVAAVDQLTATYAAVLASYPASAAEWDAYHDLDALRMAVMEGRLADFFAALP